MNTHFTNLSDNVSSSSPPVQPYAASYTRPPVQQQQQVSRTAAQYPSNGGLAGAASAGLVSDQNAHIIQRQTARRGVYNVRPDSSPPPPHYQRLQSPLTSASIHSQHHSQVRSGTFGQRIDNHLPSGDTRQAINSSERTEEASYTLNGLGHYSTQKYSAQPNGQPSGYNNVVSYAPLVASPLASARPAAQSTDATLSTAASSRKGRKANTSQSGPKKAGRPSTTPQNIAAAAPSDHLAVFKGQSRPAVGPRGTKRKAQEMNAPVSPGVTPSSVPALRAPPSLNTEASSSPSGPSSQMASMPLPTAPTEYPPDVFVELSNAYHILLHFVSALNVPLASIPLDFIDNLLPNFPRPVSETPAEAMHRKQAQANLMRYLLVSSLTQLEERRQGV
ncbi:hypothetical protein D9758_000860 [Tetrapyrgos nigripes]|uniref:Uncharacterized protein n=1 Tax=Tetrapyrgos nigripes TaxID=182062 RepID=A0A8H5H014_9AGAR|nr:hypothetical protein D9758_000860 [Tetrapyrgos nigripes]